MVNQPNIGREFEAAELASLPDAGVVLFETSPPAIERDRSPSKPAIAALVCGSVAVWGTVITGGVAVAKEMRQMQREPLSSWNFITADQQQAKTPDSLRGSFEQALSYDTCETKVDAGEPAAAYLTAFGPSSITNLPEAQLETAYEEAQEAQQKLGQELTYITPPMQEYNAILQDINRETPTLPFAQYQTVFNKILSDFGITAVYGWDAETTDPSRAGLIEPLSPSALESSQQARRVIIQAAADLVGLPVELVKASGVEQLVLGDIQQGSDDQGEKILGQAIEGTPIIQLDILKEPSEPLTFSPITHEIFHHLDEKLCGQAYDLAYASLNGRGIDYGNATASGLEYLSVPYTTLQQSVPNGTKMAAFDRPYGAESPKEDKATMFDEGLLSGSYDVRLFDATINTEVLKKKIALELARLNIAEPKLAQFYMGAIRMARYNHEVVDQLAWPNQTAE